MPRYMFAAMAMFCALSTNAHAAQICSWLVETGEAGHERALDLWLESDTSVDFLYTIGGKGIISSVGEANSPTRGSYSLRGGIARKLWHFETTFYPPGKIDITLDTRRVPTDYYSGAPTAILASFAFARTIPASETSPPPTLAVRQCEEIVNAG